MDMVNYNIKMLFLKNLQWLNTGSHYNLSTAPGDMMRILYTTHPSALSCQHCFYHQYCGNSNTSIERNKNVQNTLRKVEGKVVDLGTLCNNRIPSFNINQESLSECNIMVGNLGKFLNCNNSLMPIRNKKTMGAVARLVDGFTSGVNSILERTMENIKSELGSHVYQSPRTLRMRTDINSHSQIKPDHQSVALELHRDTKQTQTWQEFKGKNSYLGRVKGALGVIFPGNELSESLTEICRVDPTFDRNRFLEDCEHDFIPNILEAIIRGDLKVLRDWCHDDPYFVLSEAIKEAKKSGFVFSSRLLDINDVELVMGKVLPLGPVLVINFTTQQIFCMKDRKNKVVEGDPGTVLHVSYVWVLSRDCCEYNPKAAWRLLDLSAHSREQMI